MDWVGGGVTVQSNKEGQLLGEVSLSESHVLFPFSIPEPDPGSEGKVWFTGGRSLPYSAGAHSGDSSSFS